MANTPIHSFILIARTTQTTSVLSPNQMVAIDTRIEELRYAFDHDQEMSDEDYETLGHINYCERMQVFGECRSPVWTRLDSIMSGSPPCPTGAEQ